MPTYNSATDGPIELSYKGKALLQVERKEVIEAITAGDFRTNDMALSRARAALARYMGELESKIDVAVAQLSDKIPDQRPYAGRTATATMSGGSGNFQNMPRYNKNPWTAEAINAYARGRDAGFDVGRNFALTATAQNLYDMVKMIPPFRTPFKHGFELEAEQLGCYPTIDLPKPAKKKRKGKVIRKSKRAYSKARRAK